MSSYLTHRDRVMLRVLRRAMSKLDHTLMRAVCARIVADMGKLGGTFYYYRQAHDCRKLSDLMSTPGHRQGLLRTARTWLDMARERGRVPLP